MSFKSVTIDVSHDVLQRTNTVEVMSDALYANFKALIENEIGIRLGLYGRERLSHWLQKRLKETGASTFEAYYGIVANSERNEPEIERLIESVTIHKTEFFRHIEHFHYLTQIALPEIIVSRGTKRRCRVWCAGCSTGQEAYSLAMALNEFAAQHPKFHFSVLATDVSQKVLHHAQRGIYDEEMVDAIPCEWQEKYLLKGKGKHKGKVRFCHELRTKITFEKLNFHKSEYNLAKRQDIIFCRNVLIYFDRSVQETILKRLCRCLRPNGYLFLGASETLNGMTLPLARLAAKIYRKLPDELA